MASLEKYKKLEKVGEGTYGYVFRAIFIGMSFPVCLTRLQYVSTGGGGRLTVTFDAVSGLAGLEVYLGVGRGIIALCERDAGVFGPEMRRGGPWGPWGRDVSRGPD